MNILFFILNLAVLAANIIVFMKFPKWEFYKEGIRFFNKKKQITMETDKPLKK